MQSNYVDGPSSSERPINNDTIQYSKLVLVDVKPIGCGAFGDVYRAVHTDWSWQVAYKKLDIRYIIDERRIKELKYEAEIHRQLRHPHIVSMLGVVFEERNYGLVLEYLVYGSLDKFLEHLHDIAGQKYYMSWKVKTKIIRDISCAMVYLHNLPVPVIHGDLKTQNLLLGEQLITKITDFGLSKWKNYSRSYTRAGTIQGTPSHIPPEKWTNNNLDPNEMFDVYSMGIMMWELFTEQQAFANCVCMIKALVVSGDRPPMTDIPYDVPQSVKSLMVASWDGQPGHRPRFTDLNQITNQLFTIEENEIQKDVQHVLRTYNKKFNITHKSAHAQKLACHDQAITDVIRRTDKITAVMFEKKALTLEEYSNIRSQPNEQDRTHILVDILNSKPVTSYQCFLDALKSTNQPHIYQLLVDEDYLLNIDHKMALVDNYTFLQENLLITGSTLAGNLLEVGVLDQQELDKINSERTDRDKTEQLLHFLLRTSHEQYQLFLQTLVTADQLFIADRLRGTEQKKTVKKLTEDKLSSMSYLQQSSLVHAIPCKDEVRGVAVVGSQIFIACHKVSHIEVYDANNFTMLPNLTLSKKTLSFPDVAACSHYNCVYVRHWSKTESVIYRAELSNSSVTKWTRKSNFGGISVTKNYNLLMTLLPEGQIQEYTTYGILIREISFDRSIDNPMHCIQLSDDKFAVCHMGSTQHRVCIVDSRGQIMRSYGEAIGSGQYGPLTIELNGPIHMSVDDNKNVFVADCYSDRVLLFSPTLTLLGTVQTSGYKMNRPIAIHVDEINRRLYVGKGKCLLVLTFDGAAIHK